MWPPSLQTPSVLRTLAVCPLHLFMLSWDLDLSYLSITLLPVPPFSNLLTPHMLFLWILHIASDLEAAIQQKKYREMSQGTCFHHEPNHLEASALQGMQGWNGPLKTAAVHLGDNSMGGGLPPRKCPYTWSGFSCRQNTCAFRIPPPLVC